VSKSGASVIREIVGICAMLINNPTSRKATSFCSFPLKGGLGVEVINFLLKAERLPADSSGERHATELLRAMR
jgi:hypothetical protein